jgi:hypothetical protein
VDRRAANTVGCKGYSSVLTKDIIELYSAGKTMKEIAAIYGISHWTVLDRLDRAGVKKNIKHPVQNDKVFGMFTKESCYWAGFIAADGFVGRPGTIGVELAEVDREHLEKLCRFVGRDETTHDRRRKRGDRWFDYCSIVINSKTVAGDLLGNFNIVRAKSRVIMPPDKIPQELQRHFLRGYIDGDGCVGWSKSNKLPRLAICSGSKDMLGWIHERLLLAAGDKYSSVMRKVKAANTYVVEYNGRFSIGLLDWLYEGSTPETRLDRKYARYVNYKQACNQSTVDQ